VSDWPSTRAKLVLAALLRIGWTVERRTVSHKVLSRPGWPNLVFAFHDRRTPNERINHEAAVRRWSFVPR
jgi:predicted RNA binding protein YcfA (HicA-like mRNA interferase family)